MYSAFLTIVTVLLFSLSGKASATESTHCIRLNEGFIQILPYLYKEVGLYDLCLEMDPIHFRDGDITHVEVYKLNDDTYHRESLIISEEFKVHADLDGYRPELYCGSSQQSLSKWVVSFEGIASDMKPSSKIFLSHEFETFGIPGSCSRKDTVNINGKDLSIMF